MFFAFQPANKDRIVESRKKKERKYSPLASFFAFSLQLFPLSCFSFHFNMYLWGGNRN